jgi:hypothetical protein
VVSKRGPLTITVDGETEVIADGSAYRVLLDPPTTMAQGPEGAGAHKEDRRRGMNGPPLKAARSHFLIAVAAATGVVTWLAVSEALESPDRPEIVKQTEIEKATTKAVAFSYLGAPFSLMAWQGCDHLDRFRETPPRRFQRARPSADARLARWSVPAARL